MDVQSLLEAPYLVQLRSLSSQAVVKDVFGVGSTHSWIELNEKRMEVILTPLAIGGQSVALHLVILGYGGTSARHLLDETNLGVDGLGSYINSNLDLYLLHEYNVSWAGYGSSF